MLYRKVIPAALIAVIWLSIPAVSHASAPPPRIEPYIDIRVTPDEVDLGTITSFRDIRESEPVKVRVAANIPHNGIIVSGEPLKQEGGSMEIPLSRIYVRRLPSGTYRSLTTPFYLTAQLPPGIFEFEILIKVHASTAETPGTYRGTITLTAGLAP